MFQDIGNNNFHSHNTISNKKGTVCIFGEDREFHKNTFRFRSPVAKIKAYGKDTISISSKQLGNSIIFACEKGKKGRGPLNCFIYDGKRITRILPEKILKKANEISRWTVKSFDELPLANASDEAMKAFKQFVYAIRKGKIKL